MNFVSVSFAAFLAIVYVLHWSCRHAAARKWLLTIASYVFYAAWNWRYCFLMLFVTANAFVAGRLLGGSARGRKKAVLAGSIAADLAVLGFFKYYDFFLSNIGDGLASLGASVSLPAMRVILPIGISFYTFHAISYVVDAYRSKVRPESFLDVALYISFFPQLIAGPIVRASFMMPQIHRPRPFSRAQQAIGVRLLVRGFVYKALIADTLAQIADPVFADIARYDVHALLTATIAFYGQIYFDFAGYSSMAIGTARLLGYRFPTNFNYPYRAASATEFWRRWHMSLSFWLRDYLYIPLGGNRGGTLFVCRNLMITMLLGGLWHGAAWTFVVWGGLHGLLLVTHRIWTQTLDRTGWRPFGLARDSAAWRWISRILLFHAVCAGWVFFRASTFGIAFDVFRSLGAGGAATLATAPVCIVLVLGLAGQFTPPRWRNAFEVQLGRWPALARGAALAAAIALIEILGPAGVAPFIYFQF